MNDSEQLIHPGGWKLRPNYRNRIKNIADRVNSLHGADNLWLQTKV